MIACLSEKSPVGVARGWLLLALVVAALTIWLTSAERADDATNRAIGAATQREADQRITLERIGEAQTARAEIREDRDGARYQQCRDTARTPANCERFRPLGDD